MKTLLVILSLVSSNLYSQTYIEEIRLYQDEQNAEFSDPETSPLTEEDRAEFLGLDFFPIDSNYRVVATLERTPEAPVFEMPTSTERKPRYRQYGILTFKLKGKQRQLPIYQNLELQQNPKYKDYLFLPFTDLTNGFETYGGGRYLDARIPDGDTLIIDFNKAYNPYCAYNYKYSCPIPPRENHLETHVKAGVKEFKNH